MFKHSKTIQYCSNTNQLYNSSCAETLYEKKLRVVQESTFSEDTYVVRGDSMASKHHDDGKTYMYIYRKAHQLLAGSHK